MNKNKTQAADQPQALDVSVKVFPTTAQEDSKRLATASVTLGGCFAIRGVTIVDSKNGAFVSMPQRKDSKGEYSDICFPTTKEMREAISTAVLDEYQKTMDRAFSRAGQSMEKRESALGKLKKAAARSQRAAPPRNKARASSRGER